MNDLRAYGWLRELTGVAQPHPVMSDVSVIMIENDMLDILNGFIDENEPIGG